MGEENQNTTVSLRDKTRQFLDFQMNARKQQAQDFGLKRAKQQQDLYTSGLNSTNPEISKQCTKAVRVGQIAEGIRDYFSKPENGGEDYSNIEDVPLVDNYISLNPDRKAQLYDYVLEDNQICDPTQLYTDMGWISEEENTETSSTGANIAQGVLDTIMGPGKFISKQIDKGAAWVAKQFSDNDEAIDEQLQKNLEYMPTLPNVDRESTSYQTSNLISDLGGTVATSFIPGVGEAKWAAWAAKYPKLIKLMQKSPKLVELLKLGGEGVKDTVVYNALNAEGTDLTEGGAGGLLNIVFGKGGQALGKISDKIGISGIMTPGNARKVTDAIKTEGGKVGDLATWFRERGFVGSKDEIAQQLKDWATNAKKLKDELFSTVDDRFESEETTKILNKLIDSKSGVVGQEELLQALKSMLKEDNKYTLTEMQRVLRELDDSPLNPYKLGKVGETKSSEEAIGNAKLRDKVKNLLETKSDELGLGDIKSLNNEIIVATKAKDGIVNKSIGEQIKEGLSGITIPAAILGYIQEGDLGGALKYMGGTIALKKIAGTKTRTWLSDQIARLQGKERVNLTKRLESNGKQALTDAESKVLSDILESAEGENKSNIAKWIIESLRAGGVVGGSELADSITGD